MLSVTYIPFNKDQYGHVKRVLKALSKQDTSFRFWIKKRKRPGFEYLALIRSYSLDQAHRRGMLITRKYLTEIQPPLSYKAFEATSLSAQIYLGTRSLKVLADPWALSLLVALNSSEPMSLQELSKALGTRLSSINPHFRSLLKSELIAKVRGRYVVSELGSKFLAKMHAPQKVGETKTNEEQ
jgi:hypothetical protein